MRAPGAPKLLPARTFLSFIQQLSLLPFSKDLFNKLPLYESISALRSPEQKRREKKYPKTLQPGPAVTAELFMLERKAFLKEYPTWMAEQPEDSNIISATAQRDQGMEPLISQNPAQRSP